MVSIEASHRSSLSCQSFRELIEKSIDDATPVPVEVGDGDIREVAFKEFTLNDLCAAGTADNGATTVVVVFPEKDNETQNPVVVLGK